MNVPSRYSACMAITASMVLSISALAHADLTLESSSSKVTVVSTKVTGDGSTSATELFRFNDLSGEVDDKGNATVTIALANIETGVDIRNERMAEYLFETGEYPDAVINALIPPEMMEQGDHTTELQATLDMHGKSSELTIPVAIDVRDNTVIVNSTEPVLFDTSTHEFEGGLAKLADLAKVFHIPATVPVSINLSFAKAGN